MEARIIEEETRTVIELYRDALSQYDQILHLDMHTGYGPRYQMSLVNSVHETRPSAEFVARFNYPLVVAATGEEFYAIQGDMVDYYYELWKKEFPDKRFYSGAFEFGTVREYLGWNSPLPAGHDPGESTSTGKGQQTKLFALKRRSSSTRAV